MSEPQHADLVAPARQAHRPSRRSLVVDAAVVAVAELSTGATLQDVAREAQMTLSSVYYHFSSLAEIMDELIEEAYRRAAECFTSQPAGISLEEWLTGSIQALCRWMQRDPIAAHLIVGSGDIPSGGAERMSTMHACADDFRTIVAEQATLRNGRLSSEQAWMTASATLALVSGIRVMVREANGALAPETLSDTARTVAARIAAWSSQV